MNLSSEHVQSLMMIAGLGIICWLMMRKSVKSRRKSELPLVLPPLGHNANISQDRNTFTGTRSLGAPAEVLRWQVELHDLARELKAELDCKIIAVRKLTENYDSAANRLQTLIAEAQRVDESAASPFTQTCNLVQQGWPIERVASTVGLTVAEVQVIADIGLKHKRSESQDINLANSAR